MASSVSLNRFRLRTNRTFKDKRCAVTSCAVSHQSSGVGVVKVGQDPPEEDDPVRERSVQLQSGPVRERSVRLESARSGYRERSG